MTMPRSIHIPVIAVAIALAAALAPVSRAADPAPVFAPHGIVVSASPRASEVGVSLMRSGANAFDAAAAVGFALAVTWPEAGNLGGGGFMVAVKADHTALSLDFREKAPAGAHRDMFLDSHGDVIPDLSLKSPLASGVPGSVDGLLRLWRDHGSGAITRAELLAPAIKLAQDGFSISAELADTLNAHRETFSADPGAARIFLRADRNPWQPGDRLLQKDLARTLEGIATHGRVGFYEGPIAERIASQQKRSGGLIDRADLDRYASTYRAPVRGSFRGYELVSMGPPSSGGVALIEMLNMLDPYPLKDLGWGSSAYIHLLTEVQRRAYADRAEHLGDSDFWPVPIETLLSPEYARKRAATITMDRATPSSDVSAGEAPPPESPETTHYSVVDADGNAVAVTVTLNAGFGSGIVIDGAGFLMNNEMDDFSAKPGSPNLFGLVGAEANAIAPEKRMLSSMTPTIVLKNNRPWLVLGSPGGGTIINTVLQIVLNVSVHGMDIQEAVNAPRHHSQWRPDIIMYEPRAFPANVRDALQALGHTLDATPRRIGAANCILIGDDGVYGAPDPRRQSAAAGF